VIAAMDFFVVPTVRFKLLYVWFVIEHDRRHLLHVNVTAHPTSSWTIQYWDTTGSPSRRTLPQANAMKSPSSVPPYAPEYQYRGLLRRARRERISLGSLTKVRVREKAHYGMQLTSHSVFQPIRGSIWH